MANKFQLKRTSISGRTPNTTNVSNTSYIDAGELAVNLTDQKLFTSNGSAHFEVGSNLNTLSVISIIANGSSGTVGQVLTANGTGVYWGAPGSSSTTINGTLTVTDSIIIGNSTVNTTLSATSINATTVGGNSASDLRTYTDNKAANAYANAVAYTNTFASNATNLTSGTVAEARLPYRMNQDVRTTDTVSFANMTVTGNLTVTGTTVTISANNLSVTDNLIYLNNGSNNTNVDLGFTGNYNDGTYRHAGFFRDATDGVWKVFDQYLPEPDAAVNIDTSNASFRIAGFQANAITGGSLTVAGNSNFDSGTLFVDSVNNRVGIGTTSPTESLDVLSKVSINSDGTLNWGAAKDYGRLTWDTGKAIVRGASGKALSLGANGAQDYVYINTSGDVGIGTTSPANKFHVRGDLIYFDKTGLQEPTIRFRSVNDSYTSQWGVGHRSSSNDFAFRWYDGVTGWVERFAITTAGNVGIGASSPQGLLQIGSSSAETTDLLRLSVNYDTSRNVRGAFSWADSSNITGRIWTEYDGTMTSMRFGYLYNSAYTTNSTMIIRGDGNVGIGTTSPSSKLSIEQSGITTTTTVINAAFEAGANAPTVFDFDHYASADSVGSSFIRFRKANGTKASPTVSTNRATGRIGSQIYDGSGFFDNGLILFSADGAPSLGSTPGRIQFYTTASGSTSVSERMRIDSSGNVGIGTTSPSYKLDVQGSTTTAVYLRALSSNTASYSGVLIQNSGTSGQNWELGVGGSATSSTYAGNFYIYGNSSPIAVFTPAGNMGLNAAPLFTVGSGIEITKSGTATLRLDSGSFATEVYGYTDGTGIYQLSAGYLTFGTNNTERVRITSDGNMLMGTTSNYRNGKFVIKAPNYSQTSANANFHISTSDTQGADIGGSIGLGGQVGGDETPFAYISGRKENSTSGNYAGYFAIVTQDSSAGLAERFRITSTGNVGIGTNSPQYKLDVNGNVNIRQGSYLHKDFADNTEEFLIRGDATVWNGFISYTPSSGTANRGFKFGAWDNAGSRSDWVTFWNGNVGIGTTSPSSILTLNSATPDLIVNGTNAATTYGVKIRYNNSTTHGLHLTYYPNAAVAYIDNTYEVAAGQVYGDIYFRQNVAGTMTPRMTIKADGGNVGIGTTSPAERLHVDAGSGLPARLVSSAFSGVEFHNTNGTWKVYVGTETGGGGARYNSADSVHNWYNNSSAAMRLNSTGLGIGTTSPTQKLHVAGNIYTSGNMTVEATSASFVATSPGVTTFYHICDTSGALLSVDGAWPIRFNTNSTERARITSAGDLLVGTTSATTFVSGTETTLTIKGNSAGKAAALSVVNASGDCIGGFGVGESIDAVFTGTATNHPVIFLANNTERARITAAGDFGIGTNSPLGRLVVNGGTINTSTYTSGEARIADGSLHLMKTNAGAVFEAIRAMNSDTTAGTTVRFLAASTSDPFNNANGGKVFIDAIRTATNMDLAFSLNDVAGAAPTERVRFSGNGNVGIGTTSPATLLSLGSPSHTSPGDTNRILNWYSTSGGTELHNSTHRITIGVNSADTSQPQVVGMSLFNSNSTNNNWSPVLIFGGLSTSGNYMNGAAGIAAQLPTNSDDSNFRGGDLHFFTQGTTNSGKGLTSKLVIKAGGNVGIGTTSPGYKLTVASGSIGIKHSSTTEMEAIRPTYFGYSSSYKVVMLGANTSALTTISLGYDPVNNLNASFTGDGSEILFRRGVKFLTPNAADTAYNTNLVLLDGNVGIGTTSPATKLSVRGSTNFGDSQDDSTATHITRISGYALYYDASTRYGSYGNLLLNANGSWTGNARKYLITSGFDTSKFAIIRSVDATTDPSINSYGGGISSGTADFVINNAGNVGIGSTSPSYKLTTNYTAPATFTNAAGDFNQMWQASGTNALGVALSTGDTTARFVVNNSYAFAWNSAASELMRLTSAGNVGIGTTNPTGKLTVSNAGAAGIEFFPTGGVGGGAYYNAYNRSTSAYIPWTNYASAHTWYVSTAGNVRAMDLDSSGNLGVGTTSPATKLDVNGTISLSGFPFAVKSGNYNVIYEPSGIVAFYIGNATDPGNYHDNTAHIFRNRGGSSNYMYIGSSGVGIGTTSPSCKLDIVGTNSAIALSFGTTVPNNPLFINTYGGYSGIGMDQTTAGLRLAGDYSGSSNPLVDIGYYTSGSVSHANWVSRMRINQSGNVGIGTTSPGYKLEVNGSFAATTKSFVIDHPTKPGMKLRYGSLEGPENGVYVRGKLQGNIIELPDYWTELVDEETITVSLTPIGKSQNLFVEKIEGNKVYIGGDNVNCFFVVFAERKDVEKLVVEY